MPFKQGSSQQVKSFNIRELIKTKPGAVRAKGIRTLAKRRNISLRKAKILQAKAIGMDKARRS